ncbi:MAG: glycosyltransferase family 2 protein [Rhodospirillales bacterium]|nr:glycosyltransferase family 2 protein [Rhodospirillales bacterium]
MSTSLVTVIIPAYNAETTITETIDSVLAQTYKNLEIIIVDDGSTDGTPALLDAIADKHDNIKIIRQKNAGVAAARNTAIAAAQGSYIAPMDADDLWHPQRIAMHVAALEAAGPQTAVAYSPFHVIDKEGKVLGKSSVLDFSGNVFLKQLERNLVGNGSGITVRKDALIKVGGYASHLRNNGAQGCEDYLVQLQLAYEHDYVCVPYYLIGYRVYPGNMSSNHIQMLRSELLMYDHFKTGYDVSKWRLARETGETLSALVFLVRREDGNIAAIHEIFNRIRNTYDLMLFICIMSKSVLFKLKGKLERFFKKPDPPGPRRGEKEYKTFADVAAMAPE